MSQQETSENQQAQAPQQAQPAQLQNNDQPQGQEQAHHSTVTDKPQPKIVLHWLDHSRASRIIWLLEKLKLKYEIKAYHRSQSFRAPKELTKIHPLGKSPILEIDGKILTESGFIFQYLLQRFDKTFELYPVDPEKRLLVEYYLHYTEGTLQGYFVSILVLKMSVAKIPFVFRLIGGKVIDGILQGFYYPNAYKNLEYLEKQLADTPGDFFVGDYLTAADIMLSFPLSMVLGDKEGRVPIEKDAYPNLRRWLSKVEKDPDYQKTQQIVSKL